MPLVLAALSWTVTGGADVNLDRDVIEVLLGLKPGELLSYKAHHELVTNSSMRTATVTVERLIGSGHLIKTGSGLVVTKLGRAFVGITEEECAS